MPSCPLHPRKIPHHAATGVPVTITDGAWLFSQHQNSDFPVPPTAQNADPPGDVNITTWSKLKGDEAQRTQEELGA
jgi:hypothetical protein